ncbi:MAG: CaiB/BaiF CoA-transferase family protein [Burkholderiales bacterium]|nr:CaiB/BaiF CoA-transferase family protein [Burkholderiales bacterium]
MKMPLEDVVVLDLSHALAGPHCSTMLADYGATVFKLESPDGGDISRAWGAAAGGGGAESAYFVSLHRNKRGLSINLKSPEGKELFLKVIEKADVMIENFRPGALEKLGLGYAAVSARNPGIIYASISGFGQDGPYRERAAMDLILQAESGMISITGEEGGSGVRCGTSIADMTAGMYAAFGIMLALRVKDKTGQGQRIDMSMMEGQLGLLNTMIASYGVEREMPAPMGTAYKALLPYQTLRTKTGDLAIAVGSEKLWKEFCPAIGRPDLLTDERFVGNRLRVTNRTALIDIVQTALLTKTYEEWEQIFLKAGIPVGAVNNIGQVVDHPQVAARESLITMDHPRSGKVLMANVPVRLSKTPGSVRTPAPALGEHTGEILQELLGLSSAEVARLAAAGVVVTA